MNKNTVTSHVILTLFREDLLVNGYDAEISDEKFIKVAEEMRKLVSANFHDFLATACRNAEVGDKFFAGLSEKQYSALSTKMWENNKTMEEYLNEAKSNYVIVEENGQAYHWDDNEYDYTVYADKEEAEITASFSKGVKVMTEYDYLISKGFKTEYLK